MNGDEGMTTRKAPKVLAIASGKGGVGKTMIASHLGAHAARKGMKTLLLDADLGLANIDVALGLMSKGSMGDVLLGHASFDDVICQAQENLDVLPGGSGLSELSNLDGQQQLQLMGELEALGHRYDLIVIDAGAGIGDNVLFFVSSAQAPIVVINPEPTSLTDAYALIKTLSLKRGMKHFMVLMNQADEISAQLVYKRLEAVTDRYLNVSLDYVGAIPRDEVVLRYIRSQQLIPATSEFSKRLGVTYDKILNRPIEKWNRGGMQLFWERSLQQGLDEA